MEDLSRRAFKPFWWTWVTLFNMIGYFKKSPRTLAIKLKYKSPNQLIQRLRPHPQWSVILHQIQISRMLLHQPMTLWPTKHSQIAFRNRQNLCNSVTWTMPTSLTCSRCPQTPVSRSRWALTMARTSRPSLTLRERTSTSLFQWFLSLWKHTLLSGKTLMIIRWKTAPTYSAFCIAPRVVRMI